MVIDQKSNAIAIEIVTKKSNAIVIMHYFCDKSNSIIEVCTYNCHNIFFALCNFLKNGKIYPKSDFWVPGKISVEKLIEDTQQESAITYLHTYKSPLFSCLAQCVTNLHAF